MSKIILARHGAHVNNVLTEAGRVEVGMAAAHAAKKLRGQNVASIVLVTSEEPRAVQSADIWQAVLDVAGIDVERIPANEAFNPAEGVAAWANGEHPPCPKYGSGDLTRYWLGLGTNLPKGVEPFQLVACRALEQVLALLRQMDDERQQGLVVVCHGGTIEPAVMAWTPDRVLLPDIPSSAVVYLDDEADGFEVHDPASIRD